MATKHPSLAAAALLVACCGLPESRAEVSAQIDAQGNYLRTVILVGGSLKSPKIWSLAQGVKRDYVPLNRHGDRNGDLWPAIAENPALGQPPWVVWSRFGDAEYDLGWSRWVDGQWAPVAWLETAPDGAGDDLDPSLTLDAGGRPFVVWWRNEEGSGRVYLSLFLASRWTEPFAVSDLGVDSRYPTIEWNPDDTLTVTYTTALGVESRILVFARPDSVTDDLNPFDQLAVLNPAPNGGGNRKR